MQNFVTQFLFYVEWLLTSLCYCRLDNIQPKGDEFAKGAIRQDIADQGPVQSGDQAKLDNHHPFFSYLLLASTPLLALVTIQGQACTGKNYNDMKCDHAYQEHAHHSSTVMNAQIRYTRFTDKLRGARTPHTSGFDRVNFLNNG